MGSLVDCSGFEDKDFSLHGSPEMLVLSKWS